MITKEQEYTICKVGESKLIIPIKVNNESVETMDNEHFEDTTLNLIEPYFDLDSLEGEKFEAESLRLEDLEPLTRKAILKVSKIFCEVLPLDEVQTIIKYLLTTDYFTAPASTKYHLNYKHGLVEHSINVLEVFKKLNIIMDWGFTPATMVKTSLLHDLCKCNIYVENILKSGKISDTNPYKKNDMLPIGHSEKSLYLATKIVDLTQDEVMLIRFHMGNFDRGFSEYGLNLTKNFPKTLALHFSDWMASLYRDTKGFVHIC